MMKTRDTNRPVSRELYKIFIIQVFIMTNAKNQTTIGGLRVKKKRIQICALLLYAGA